MAKISDNLLAAFLDGKTTAAETRAVLNAAATDPELQEVIRITAAITDDIQRSQTRVFNPLAIDAGVCCANVRAARITATPAQNVTHNEKPQKNRFLSLFSKSKN